jgi:hypothetical protein
MPSEELDDVTMLIRMEYLEMPDLKLTLSQAKRLWNLPADRCAGALRTLVEMGFLAQAPGGSFFRCSDTPENLKSWASRRGEDER